MSSAAISETQPSLYSIDSFSNSWIVNLKPSLENQEDDFSLSFSSRFSLDELNSFIEMDPKLSLSRRFFSVPQQESSNYDELMYNGYLIMPFFEQNMEKIDDSPISSSLDGKQEVPYLRKVGSKSLGRWRRLSKNMFLKYFGFVRHFFKKIRILQNKKIAEKKCSMEDNCDWRRSCDSESSIHEAVLHCKRTIDAGKEGKILDSSKKTMK